MVSRSNLLLMHLTCGNIKKGMTSSIKELRENILTLFNLPEHQVFRIQSWVDEFSDWEDVNDQRTLKELPRCKLNIILGLVVSGVYTII